MVVRHEQAGPLARAVRRAARDAPRRARRLRLALTAAPARARGAVSLVRAPATTPGGRRAAWAASTPARTAAGSTRAASESARAGDHAPRRGRAARIPAPGSLPGRALLPRGRAGRGGAATAVKVNEIFANVSEYRDIVLVDQRGTGGSHPWPARRSTCLRRTAGRVPRTPALLRAARRRARFLTTDGGGRRLERVRRALGYGRIDIYGSSYGATLAQEYLRRHCGSVRTATLDGHRCRGARSTSSPRPTPSAR